MSHNMAEALVSGARRSVKPGKGKVTCVHTHPSPISPTPHAPVEGTDARATLKRQMRSDRGGTLQPIIHCARFEWPLLQVRCKRLRGAGGRWDEEQQLRPRLRGLSRSALWTTMERVLRMHQAMGPMLEPGPGEACAVREAASVCEMQGGRGVTVCVPATVG